MPLQEPALRDARWIVEFEQAHGGLADGRSPHNANAHQPEMIAPCIGARIEKPDESPSDLGH